MRRSKVFIGSSVEGLPVANALRRCWHHTDFVADVWCDAGFKLSTTTIEALEAILDKYEYGVFVFTPDDRLVIRDEETTSVRDNVLFELGLFLGRHGRKRSFIVLPRHEPPRLPTDLRAIAAADYEIPENAEDADAWVGRLRPAADEIAGSIQASRRISDSPVTRYFSDFMPEFARLFAASKLVTVFFIHSRRWREQMLRHLTQFLDRDDTTLTVLLPDRTNGRLIQTISEHFDDRDAIPGLIDDAYRFFGEQASRYSGKVEVRATTLYPTYSFYKFDETMITAMYPTTIRRKDVPAFMIDSDSPYWSFLMDDLRELLRTSKKPSRPENGKSGSSWTLKE